MMPRLYRLLILLQPREVRRRYGAEMEQVMRERAAEGFAVREILDALRSAASARRAFLGWLFVAGAAAHSAYAAWVFPVKIMGFAAVLLTAAFLLAGAAMVAVRRAAA